ncbi:hypothetical protein C8R46DRAFT_1328667 [Mycena filopes]|nr:hypothetical protein C8R46DRAFT_1328667 [Mycena filopes]
MSFCAIFSTLALVAVFLGLTLYSSLFAGQKPQLASSPSLFSKLLNIRRPQPIPAPLPPQTLAQRWISHTWDVLHHTRFHFGGLSPLLLFVSIVVPTVLVLVLIRQHHQYDLALESELHKRRLIDVTLIQVQRIRDERMQPVKAIHAALICTLCNKGYTRPYILAPCGHTFDLPCLKRVFRTPSSTKTKSCPTCHAPIRAPPALSWTVKTVADAVAQDDDEEPYPVPTRDVWKGFVFEVPPRVQGKSAVEVAARWAKAWAGKAQVWVAAAWENARRQTRQNGSELAERSRGQRRRPQAQMLTWAIANLKNEPNLNTLSFEI